MDTEIIRFGNYDWLVLDKQDDMLLIFTEKVIEKRSYHHGEHDFEDIKVKQNGEIFTKLKTAILERRLPSSITITLLLKKRTAGLSRCSFGLSQKCGISKPFALIKTICAPSSSPGFAAFR